MRSHIACLPYPKVLGAYPKRSFHIQQSSPAQPTLHTQTSLQKPVLSALAERAGQPRKKPGVRFAKPTLCPATSIASKCSIAHASFSRPSIMISHSPSSPALNHPSFWFIWLAVCHVSYMSCRRWCCWDYSHILSRVSDHVCLCSPERTLVSLD